MDWLNEQLDAIEYGDEYIPQTRARLRIKEEIENLKSELVEQAERVHGLENEIERLKDIYYQCKEWGEKESFRRMNLEQQNKRYREAFRQIKLQILFEGTIECHRENIIEIIDEVFEGEE